MKIPVPRLPCLLLPMMPLIMVRRFALRIAAALVLAAFAAPGHAEPARAGSAPDAVAAAPPVSSGWDYASRTLTEEAVPAFQKQESEARKAGNTEAIREAQLGQAIALINSQPKTESKLDEAVRLLEEVRKPGKTDDLATTAGYYMARIAQIHRTPPDEKLAARLYQELFAARPDHDIAQLGMVKYAMLRLYAMDTPSAERTKTLAELEALVPALTSPLARRQFHAELGKAYLFSGISREKALEHFLAQEKLGVQRFSGRAETWLRIANLAKDLGRKEIALEYYGRFITHYPRDTRNYSAVMLARELGGNFRIPSETALPEPAAPETAAAALHHSPQQPK